MHGFHRNPKRKRGRHNELALAYASGYQCAVCARLAPGHEQSRFGFAITSPDCGEVAAVSG